MPKIAFTDRLNERLAFVTEHLNCRPLIIYVPYICLMSYQSYYRSGPVFLDTVYNTVHNVAMLRDVGLTHLQLKQRSDI